MCHQPCSNVKLVKQVPSVIFMYFTRQEGARGVCFRNATVFSAEHVYSASANLSMSGGATRSFADVS
jgi:hypothetical protein